MENDTESQQNPKKCAVLFQIKIVQQIFFIKFTKTFHDYILVFHLHKNFVFKNGMEQKISLTYGKSEHYYCN